MDTLIPTSKSISSLMQEFAYGNIAIPEIQRDVVWKSEQIKELIDSINQGFPCGSLIFWEPREKDVDIIRAIIRPERLEHFPDKLPQYFLLDGQQRISALASVLLNRDQLNNLLVELEEEMPFIYANLKRFPREMEATTDGAGYTFPWILLNRLFDNSFKNSYEYTKRLKQDKKSAIDEFTQRIRDYQFPIQIIKGRDYATVGKIFARVNSLGTQLTGAEIHLANIVPHWPGITREFRQYRLELREKDYDLDLNFLMRAITVIECGVAKVKKLAERVSQKKISRNHLTRIWQQAKRATNKIIRSLGRELNLDKSKYFTSKNVLVPLVYYVAKDKSSSLASRKMVQFFLYSQLAEHYGSSGENVLQKDLKYFADLTPRQALTELVSDVERDVRQFYRGLKIKPDKIEGPPSRNVMLLLMYILMQGRRAHDFGLSKTPSLSDIGPKEIQLHHIFPFNFMMKDKAAQKMCNDHDYSPAEFRAMVNDIANLTFVSHRKNAEIGDVAPIQYLPLETDKELRRTHFIPENSDLWRPENFDRFIKERRAMISKAANSLIRNL